MNLQEDLTNSVLTRESISGLLDIFKNLGAIDADTHLHLTEVVLRRHLHVHARGIVDQRYIPATRNRIKLKVGEVATIAEDYSYEAERITKEAVESIGKCVEERRSKSAPACCPST